MRTCRAVLAGGLLLLIIPGCSGSGTSIPKNPAPQPGEVKFEPPDKRPPPPPVDLGSSPGSAGAKVK